MVFPSLRQTQKLLSNLSASFHVTRAALGCPGKSHRFDCSVTLRCHQTWQAGKSPRNGCLYRNITYKWSIVHCYVWLPEGNDIWATTGVQIPLGEEWKELRAMPLLKRIQSPETLLIADSSMNHVPSFSNISATFAARVPLGIAELDHRCYHLAIEAYVEVVSTSHK